MDGPASHLPKAPDERIARRLSIYGLVQRVYYRESCRREATELGVVGFAHNREDGSVEVHLEGTTEAVGVVISWCRHGPERARVDRIVIRDVPFIYPTSFTIG